MTTRPAKPITKTEAAACDESALYVAFSLGGPGEWDVMLIAGRFVVGGRALDLRMRGVAA